MTRVFVVEDETLVREGLRVLLRLMPEIEVAGEATDGAEAVERIPRSNAEVVLLDVRLPKLDGIQVLRTLREQGAQPPTIVLTTFNDHEIVLAALREGARGFLLKDVSLAQLREAIETVAQGGTHILPAVTDRLLRALRDAPRVEPSFPPLEPLTEREVEVLRLMAGGYSNREIAAALGVAEGTAKNHVASILSKMGARDRIIAVLHAVDSGYL
jgi:DNA-binding NarL/FixJ family response regulator